MSTDPEIIARLAAIEQQNQQVLALLAKLAGGETALAVDDGGISPARRMEIILMAAEASRTPGRKKQPNREARA